MADPDNHSSSTTNQPIAPSVIDQYENPFFLHHSDGTNLVFVSDPLTESNYTSWSQAMILGLTVKNKLGFIDGIITEQTGELKRSWIICNSVVKAWILNALSKEISASISFSDTARDMWLDLQQRYQRKNRPRIFQLRRELSNLTQDQLTVTAYFSRLKTLWNELASYRPSCSCGKCTCNGVKELVQYFQTEHVMAFLMGLNESFAQIRTQLLLMEPEPTITRAFSLVAQEVEQRASAAPIPAATPITDSTALLAKASSSASTSSSTRAQSQKKKERPFCTHCNILGHTIEIDIEGFFDTIDHDILQKMLHKYI
ncbi:MAG: hypothetical protein Q8761_02860, partial [Sweet potato little leaf phytoplasma]|nr:hypothetical protein [Sweet potato little leaf phytoplasma]